MKTCPICRRAELLPNGQTISMPHVLRRWEEAMGHSFSSEVWDDYRNVGEAPVSLMTCAECGFGQFEPVLPGTENFYRDISAVDYYNEEKWEFRRAGSDIAACRAQRVLDVGCGSGIFLKYLRRENPSIELFGFDLNEELVDSLAREGFGVLPSNPARFSDAMAGQPLFDVVTMLQVLEHVADPIEFVQTFLPLLRPGGLLIITTPNFSGPIKSFPDALTEIPPHHTTRWTEKAFRYLVSGQNLRFRSVSLEPLPFYLWDSYLPELWEAGIWPARIFDPIAQGRGLNAIGARAGMAADEMKRMGIRWIEGVPGHTIYVSAVKERGSHD